MRSWVAAGFAIGASVLPAQNARPLCPTLWLDLGGKGQDTCLVLSDAWPLTRFENQLPAWDPGYGDVGRYAGPAPKDSLSWVLLEEPASVHTVGAVGGAMVYDIDYSPSYRVLAWDVGGGALRPALIVAGDESLVAEIYRPELFRWHDRDVVHVRVQLTGTGSLQESVFLVSVDGAVVALRPDHQPLLDWLARQRLQMFHKGGGFCRGALVFQASVADESGGRVGGVVADYAIQGQRLTPESMRIYREGERPPEMDCELYPARE